MTPRAILINDEIRSLIVHERQSNEMRAAALRNGLMTLRHRGWLPVLDGVTSVDGVVGAVRKVEFTSGT